MRDIPEQALAFGFVNEPIGSHTSRTIMLPELRALLTACPADTQLEDYRLAVVEDNVLRKATVATRKGSFRQLRELYGLAPDICIFRALRDLWDSDDEAQPLLAILCATARDPILRSTASVIVELSPGDHITPEDLAAAVQ